MEEENVCWVFCLFKCYLNLIKISAVFVGLCRVKSVDIYCKCSARTSFVVISDLRYHRETVVSCVAYILSVWWGSTRLHGLSSAELSLQFQT